MKANLQTTIVFLLFVLLVNSKATHACEPIIPRHPFRDAKVVFYGELMNIKESSDQCMRILNFKVERYWKGKLSEKVSVRTATTYCCGYNFAAGGRYLVYGYAEKGGPLETSVGWVFAEDSAQDNLKKLGKGKISRRNTVSKNGAAQQRFAADPNEQAFYRCGSAGPLKPDVRFLWLTLRRFSKLI